MDGLGADRRLSPASELLGHGPKVPLPAGPAALRTAGPSRHGDVMGTAVSSGEDLSAARCRDLLLASRRGFLSCTRFAMPLVVPVDIACVHGQVLVTIHDRSLCGPLAGHVVALTVTGRPRSGRPGWTVAAVGLLLLADDGALAFEPSSLHGWTFAAPVSPPGAPPTLRQRSAP